MPQIPIFVSSAHFGLEDLRGELAAYIEEIGGEPLVSSEKGFPDLPGITPYAQCLRVLERALIVIVVVDRRYGTVLENWSPYSEYNGLSPTHGEVRHALKCQKRVLVFVREQVQAFYEMYRKNREQFGTLSLPNGLDVKALDMFGELKTANPAPWIETFHDIRDIKESLRKRILGDLYQGLVQQEKLAAAQVQSVVDAILDLPPSERARLPKIIEELRANSALSKTSIENAMIIATEPGTKQSLLQAITSAESASTIATIATIATFATGSLTGSLLLGNLVGTLLPRIILRLSEEQSTASGSN
jgi:hypothetical protein